MSSLPVQNFVGAYPRFLRNSMPHVSCTRDERVPAPGVAPADGLSERP
jgi:hypothetical protein